MSFTYFIRRFRTKKYYLIFQIFQFLLAVAIIVCALINNTHFKTPYVLCMEFALLFIMALDLFMIRIISEGFRPMIKGITGKIDLVIFIIFAVTFVFLVLNNDQQSDQILETDDILIILIVISRYAVQIYRLLTSIKETHENREMNKQMKQVDLNYNQNLSIIYQKQIQQEKHLNSMITKQLHKNQLIEQRDSPS